MEQVIHGHVTEKIPLYVKPHVAQLVQPDDVEATVESIRPALRIEFNFAQSKNQPLTDSEMENGKDAGKNGHEVSKQCFNAKTGRFQVQRIKNKKGNDKHHA